jgi:hypothetical protein
MMRRGILFAICAVLLSACTSVTAVAPRENATIAALSTDVARNGTMIAYLATVVNAQRAGTPTPVGFVPTPTPWWTPTTNATARMAQTPTTQPSFSSIEFRRSGGIVGLDDQLLIDDKGRAKLTRRTGNFEFGLAQEELARLHIALRDVNFASIPEDSRRKPYLVPDEISYVIGYQEHTVKTSDTAIPEKLQSVIQLLSGIVDAKGK